MQRDGPDAEPVGPPPVATGSGTPARNGAVVVASARVALGSLLLTGSGLARLVDAAVAADAAPSARPAGADGRGDAALRPLVSVALGAAGRGARMVATVAGAAPPVVRRPIARRLAAWEAASALEQERSRAVAAATLETAARFMTDWIVERLDVNRIVERLQLDDILAGLELTDVIVSSTNSVTGRVLDNARTRAVGADALVDRVMAHVRRRGATHPGDSAAAVAPTALATSATPATPTAPAAPTAPA